MFYLSNLHFSLDFILHLFEVLQHRVCSVVFKCLVGAFSA